MGKRKFEYYRNQFAPLYSAVRDAHVASANRGHGLDHDVAVAMMGTVLANDDMTAEMVFVAGLIHSADEMAGSDASATLDRYLAHLPAGYFTPKQVTEIREGVERHREFKDHNLDTRKTTQRAVSYTHLRAHETVLDLVCRLLLEKKKKNDDI